jgi:hypothetical protein
MKLGLGKFVGNNNRQQYRDHDALEQVDSKEMRLISSL